MGFGSCGTSSRWIFFKMPADSGSKFSTRNRSSLGLELKRVAHGPVVPGLFPVAKRRRLAVFEQRLQLVLLVERTFGPDDLKPGVVLEDNVTGLSGTNVPSHEKGAVTPWIASRKFSSVV